MRWVVFAIALLLTLTLEMSVKSVFAINAFHRVAPSFMIVLLTFTALQAPRRHAMWAALTMGLLLDLTTEQQLAGGETAFLIGPHALGYVMASYLIVQIRSVVFRQRLVTVVVFVFVAFLTASATRIVLLGVRGWFGEPTVWGGETLMGEVLRVLLVAAYSCLIAVPFGWVLLKLTPAWAFHSPHQRVTAWR